MGKRKLRVNLIDILILAVIAAAAAVLVYLVAGSKAEAAAAETVYLEYVVSVPKLEENFQNRVSVNDAVEDAVTRISMGTVYGVETKEYMSTEYDEINNREVYNSVKQYNGDPKNFAEKPMYNMDITIRAEAVVTENSYSVNGKDVYVGEQLSLIFPDMYGVGFCIEVRVLD